MAASNVRRPSYGAGKRRQARRPAGLPRRPQAPRKLLRHPLVRGRAIRRRPELSGLRRPQTVSMILRRSQFTHLVPFGGRRVLILHAVTQLRLAVDGEVERLLGCFDQPRSLPEDFRTSRASSAMTSRPSRAVSPRCWSAAFSRKDRGRRGRRDRLAIARDRGARSRRDAGPVPARARRRRGVLLGGVGDAVARRSRDAAAAARRGAAGRLRSADGGRVSRARGPCPAASISTSARPFPTMSDGSTNAGMT